MRFKLSRAVIVFATLFSLRAEAQTRSSLITGIEHFLCTQDRWGELNLDKAQFRNLEFGIMTGGKESEVGTYGDILGGTTLTGNSYLSLLNLGPQDAAVYVYEAIFAGNNSSYAEDKLDLLRRSPKFTMHASRTMCKMLSIHDKQIEKNVRLIVGLSLKDYLLRNEIPYKRFSICRFSADDPYAVALVYWKRARPSIYNITLYDILGLMLTKLTERKRGYFEFNAGRDMPLGLALKRCHG